MGFLAYKGMLQLTASHETPHKVHGIFGRYQISPRHPCLPLPSEQSCRLKNTPKAGKPIQALGTITIKRTYHHEAFN